VQENAHKIDPNTILNRSQKNVTVMDLLCTRSDEGDLEFAKFWLSPIQFAVSLDLLAEQRTCVDEILKTYSTVDFAMLKIILDSKPGQKFLLREASNLEVSPLMDKLRYSWKGPLQMEKLVEIVICHINIESITDEHKQKLGLEDKNLIELKKRMRKVHGYNPNDATRVFCLTLLISQKIFCCRQ